MISLLKILLVDVAVNVGKKVLEEIIDDKPESTDNKERKIES